MNPHPQPRDKAMAVGVVQHEAGEHEEESPPPDNRRGPGCCSDERSQPPKPPARASHRRHTIARHGRPAAIGRRPLSL
jgi:hypothetical protein